MTRCAVSCWGLLFSIFLGAVTNHLNYPENIPNNVYKLHPTEIPIDTCNFWMLSLQTCSLTAVLLIEIEITRSAYFLEQAFQATQNLTILFLPNQPRNNQVLAILCDLFSSGPPTRPDKSHMNHEINPLTFNHTGCLIVILMMVYYSPHIAG